MWKRLLPLLWALSNATNKWRLGTLHKPPCRNAMKVLWTGLSPQIKQTISEDLRSFSSWRSLHESAQFIELTMMTYQWSHFTFIHTVHSTYLLSNALISRGFHLILQRKINNKSDDSLQLLISFLELVYARNEVSRKATSQVSLALLRVLMKIVLIKSIVEVNKQFTNLKIPLVLHLPISFTVHIIWKF